MASTLPPGSLLATLLSLLLLFTTALAQSSGNYQVWASVIFARLGDRTPDALGTNDMPSLTSLGAQQAYKAGSFFRQRYVPSAPSVFGQSRATIQNLNTNIPNWKELYALALDEPASMGSAQAFLQGFYPPFTLNESVAAQLDPSSILANGTYVENPLNGYQYVQLHAAGAYDPEFPYVAGQLNCPAYSANMINYLMSAQSSATDKSSTAIYDAIDNELLSGVVSDSQADYQNAYYIWDYVNYNVKHNETFASLANQSTLDALRYLADEQQYAMLGNLTAFNNITNSNKLPGSVTGSIATLGGNLLLTKMLSQLQVAVRDQGEYYKLSLLVADYSSLFSMFALLGLPELNSNFTGIPDFASSAVFELFSVAASTSSFPDSDDLMVRFYFRNGTDDSAPYQAYPVFNRGPSETDMRYSDFVQLVNTVALGVGDWCSQCGSTRSVFCAYWANSTSSGDSDDLSSTTSKSPRHKEMNPAVAGVIGAVLSLVLAGIAFALLALFFGFRVKRQAKADTKHGLGGFKGGQKMASDRDLTLPKGGAVVGATVARSEGHERVGSWEMRNKEVGSGIGRGSVEDDEERVNPFQDPVRVSERV